MIEELNENNLEVEYVPKGYNLKPYAKLTADNFNEVINKLNEVIKELNREEFK